MAAYFKQCVMVREVPESPSGFVWHTAWIPEQFARRGKTLKLLDSDGEWENGWVVTEVGTRLSEEYVREHEQDYKTQHKASDKLTPNKGLGLK